MSLAGGPERRQQCQGSNTEEQESSKHDCPPLVENSDGAMVVAGGPGAAVVPVRPAEPPCS
jgi:hypothetical protein